MNCFGAVPTRPERTCQAPPNQFLLVREIIRSLDVTLKQSRCFYSVVGEIIDYRPNRFDRARDLKAMREPFGPSVWYEID